MAMETLYHRYLPSLWRYAFNHLGRDWHAAEDVVSETLLAFVRQAMRIEPDDRPLGAWLLTVARRRIADHWQERARSGDSGANRDRSEQPAPDDAVAALDAREQVLSTMAGLDDEQRLVLEWKYIEGLSVRQIAQRLGRTDKAAESVLFRARNAFRAACGER